MARHVPVRRALQWGAVIVATLLTVIVSAVRPGPSVEWHARALRGGASRASSRATDCLSSSVVAHEDPEATLLGHLPDPETKAAAIALRNGRPAPVIAAALRRPLAMRDWGADLGQSPYSSFFVVRALTPDAGRAPPSV